MGPNRIDLVGTGLLALALILGAPSRAYAESARDIAGQVILGPIGYPLATHAVRAAAQANQRAAAALGDETWESMKEAVIPFYKNLRSLETSQGISLGAGAVGGTDLYGIAFDGVKFGGSNDPYLFCSPKAGISFPAVGASASADHLRLSKSCTPDTYAGPFLGGAVSIGVGEFAGVNGGYSFGVDEKNLIGLIGYLKKETDQGLSDLDDTLDRLASSVGKEIRAIRAKRPSGAFIAALAKDLLSEFAGSHAAGTTVGLVSIGTLAKNRMRLGPGAIGGAFNLPQTPEPFEWKAEAKELIDSLEKIRAAAVRAGAPPPFTTKLAKQIELLRKIDAAFSGCDVVSAGPYAGAGISVPVSPSLNLSYSTRITGGDIVDHMRRFGQKAVDTARSGAQATLVMPGMDLPSRVAAGALATQAQIQSEAGRELKRFFTKRCLGPAARGYCRMYASLPDNRFLHLMKRLLVDGALPNDSDRLCARMQAEEAAIRGLYRARLGREPSGAEIEGQLAVRDGLAPEEFEEGFRAAARAELGSRKGDIVRGLYRRVLGRDTGAEDKPEQWEQRLTELGSHDALEQAFKDVAYTELRLRAPTIVRDLYLRVLGREPGPGDTPGAWEKHLSAVKSIETLERDFRSVATKLEPQNVR